MMIDWLVQHGPSLGLLGFFVGFVCIAVWTYRPALKKQIEDHAHIPFREQE